MKTENIHVGDFVACRSKYHRDQLEITNDSGLVIEIKRSNSKVLYPGDKRCWLPRESITRTNAESSHSPFLQQLNFLLKRVRAHECEIVTSDSIHRLSIQIDGIDAAAVDDIRGFLGKNYLSLSVVPEGMAFMQVEIRFT